MDHLTGRPDNINDYLQPLHPGEDWIEWNGNFGDYDSITVLVDGYSLPSKEDCEAGLAAMQADWDAQKYTRDRAAEYPDFRDYLDGIVKGDQAQIDAYIAACQSVKDKYPKPE